jgi:hypothetical protein
MEKSRKAKKSILIILLLVVVGLSIGFAAFVSELTISSSATVVGDKNTFKVVFSESQTEVTGNTATVKGTAGASGTGGTFTGTALTGLTAEFTAPGQTVTWEVYAVNDGEFDAYLKDVIIGGITCTAKSGTTQSYVDEAAKGISIKVSVRGEEYTASKADIINHELTKDSGERGPGEKIIVTLTYAANSAIADGDFDVKIGDIKLNYESMD